MHRKHITLVIPVYNEQGNIRTLYAEVQKAIAPLKSLYFFELLFVDDGSTDGSRNIIDALTREDAGVRFIALSRNFGKEIATTAGMHEATGDAVIMMDADLQHPPALIPALIREWETGVDIVVGKRKNSASPDIARRIGTWIFYALMDRIGETKLVSGGTDFRLVSRQVVDEFNKFTERGRITRGLINWLGFKTSYVSFTAPERNGSAARYGFFKLVRLALSSFISHSLFPLKFTGYLGFFIAVASGLLGIFIVTEKYIIGDPWNMHFSGPAILAVIIIFLVGIILSCLGLIALYIANIHAEVMNRPLYVIREKSSQSATKTEAPQYEKPLVQVK